jgi:phosphoglycolate phosphatase
VLFDFDGVLVDSRVPFVRSVNAALVAHGLPPRADEDLHGFLGPPLHSVFRALDAGPLVQLCVDSYRERYSVMGARETVVVAGIPAVLAELSAQLPLLVATSKAQTLAEPLLVQLGLREFFRDVVGPDLGAEDETKATTIQRALRRLPGCRRPVMVGDRMFDVIGARENGVETIGVLWGIGDAQELTDAGACALARTPSELPMLLGLRDGQRP